MRFCLGYFKEGRIFWLLVYVFIRENYLFNVYILIINYVFCVIMLGFGEIIMKKLDKKSFGVM